VIEAVVGKLKVPICAAGHCHPPGHGETGDLQAAFEIGQDMLRLRHLTHCITGSQSTC
jgi:hypothetical protein